MGAITGVSPMISALSVNTNKSTSPIYLIPRFGEDSNKDCKETIVEVPSRLWVLHVGNAFEIIHEEDGTLDFQIHASSCSYQWFNFKKLFGTSSSSPSHPLTFLPTFFVLESHLTYPFQDRS